MGEASVGGVLRIVRCVVALAIVSLVRGASASDATDASSERAGDGPVAQLPRLLSFHERNYVLSSLGSTDAVKFQLSIKYAVLPFSRRPPARRLLVPEGIYFGYTQVAIWDAYDLQDSSPMKDVNFQPELFYHRGWSTPLMSGCRLRAFQLGVRHASNGQKGDSTRAVNTIQGRLTAGCSLPGRRGPLGKAPHGSVELTAWSPPVRPVENPDLVDYIGYGRVRLTLRSGLLSDELSVAGAILQRLRGDAIDP